MKRKLIRPGWGPAPLRLLLAALSLGSALNLQGLAAGAAGVVALVCVAAATPPLVRGLRSLVRREGLFFAEDGRIQYRGIHGVLTLQRAQVRGIENRREGFALRLDPNTGRGALPLNYGRKELETWLSLPDT